MRTFGLLLAVDECGQREEGLLDGLSGDCAGLNEVDALGFAPTMDFFQRHQPLLVLLVAQQQVTRVGNSPHSHLEPHVLHVLPATHIAHVQHHHHALAGFEVGRHDGPELFLAGSVPDAQPHFSFVEADGLVAVIDGGEWMV